jgi:hypothetical protein
MTQHVTRRRFLQTSAAAVAASAIWPRSATAEPPPGERPPQSRDVTVLNPRDRVPVSLIIDDSTCLVNLAHYGIPQFAEVYPDRYLQDWRKLPREIPDSFVLKFAEWCHDHGVKGKYSIVPYPACVGWVDRRMPGWSYRELKESLDIVRDTITIDWDIHPEMISHTFAVDTKTGRPYPERTEEYLENTGFSVGKSADFLADYMAYALRILKNVGLPCEGVTTPGGFGNRSREALSLGTLQAVRDVYGSTSHGGTPASSGGARRLVPHYFRHLYTDDRSVAPRVENASGLETDDPQCVVSIIGCTGDWFGGWDGLEIGSVDQFITQDLQGGRLPQVIDRGEPAILVCHWPGIYVNGEETGFDIFKEVVRRLHARYDNLLWMKNSEIARYWAAKELTRIEREGRTVTLRAPFGTADFTLQIAAPQQPRPQIVVDGKTHPLSRVAGARDLVAGSWHQEGDRLRVCFDLPEGRDVQVDV